MGCCFKDEKTVKELQPNFAAIKSITEAEGLVITAKGNDVDFVSRFFMPNYAIDEDPVTGSSHCILAPIWHEKIGKNIFTVKQVSARSGNLICELRGDRVFITGNARLYLKGEIYLD